MPQEFIKTTNEILKHDINWVDRLTADFAGDTIASSVWTIEPATGLATSNEQVLVGNTRTSILVAGGTAGITYILTNHITLVTDTDQEPEAYIEIFFRDF